MSLSQVSVRNFSIILSAGRVTAGSRVKGFIDVLNGLELNMDGTKQSQVHTGIILQHINATEDVCTQT